MQAYSAYYENGRIVPIGNPTIPEKSKLIVTVLDEIINSPVRPPFEYGIMSDTMWMAEDFDAPLDLFEEYM